MDINQVIQESTDTFLKEKLPTLVTQKVEKMVDAVLNDIFGTYSDTAKNIKTKIEAQLNINLQEFGLADYNHMVSKAISDRLAGLVLDQSIQPILKMLEPAIGFIEKKEIRLSDIYDNIVSLLKEEALDDKGQFSFFVEEDQKYKWMTVSFDPDVVKSSKDCRISFLISNDTGRIFLFKAGNSWQPKAIISPATLSMLSKTEYHIFRLYAAQVKIEIDETEFSNEWNTWE